MKAMNDKALEQYTDWELITNFKKREITIDDYNERDSFKANHAYYFIAGNLKNNVRSNSNLIEKNLLTFDYENLNMEFEEFRQMIHNKLKDYNYFLYPSIHSYHKGVKDKKDDSIIAKIDKRFRYRLVIDTNRMYTIEENISLIKNIGKYIGIPYDDKSETYSQCMGLPILTPYTNESMLYINEGKPFPIDAYIDKKTLTKPSKPNAQINFVASRPVKYTAKMLMEFMDGVAEGNRDNWLTRQCGVMFSLGMDPRYIYQWLHLLNLEFVEPPLADKDINRIFQSIRKKEGDFEGKKGNA